MHNNFGILLKLVADSSYNIHVYYILLQIKCYLVSCSATFYACFSYLLCAEACKSAFCILFITKIVFESNTRHRWAKLFFVNSLFLIFLTARLQSWTSILKYMLCSLLKNGSDNSLHEHYTRLDCPVQISSKDEWTSHNIFFFR